MTSNQGGGTHPGDPWSPDWKPATPEETPEDDWPYDESLTLSEAELEIAGLEDDEDGPDETAEGEAEVETETGEAEEAAAREAEEEAAAREAEEAAAREAEEAEEAAAREAAEAAAREAEEAEEAEEAAAREAEEAEEAAAREAEEAEEAEEAAAREAEEAAAAVAREAEEAAAREAEEAAAAAAREAEEAAAREAEEAAAAVAREAEEAAAREAEEAAAREAEEAAAAAAREAEEAAAREAEEAAAAVAREAEEAAAREAEDGAARETEDRGEPEAGLRAVIDDAAEPDDEFEAPLDEVIEAPIEEVAVEDLQAEPEWLEAVEEMSLDDIADAGELPAPDKTPMAVVPAEPVDETTDEVETPTEVIDSIVAAEAEDIGAVVIEDATFEVVDLDDADLRGDTAEHLFEALDFEGEGVEAAIAHDEITAEVPAVAEAPAPIPKAADPPPVQDIDFEIPAEYDSVAASVDETSDALAAFMAPPPDAGGFEADAVAAEDGHDGTGAMEDGAERDDDGEAGSAHEAVVEGQLQIGTAAAGGSAAGDRSEPAETGPLTPEEELIASLSGDLTLPDFETFVREDFSRDFAPEPTQEHRGLAETMSNSDVPEPSAVAAAMPGVDHGHVGFQEFDEELHFDDPDDVEKAAPAEEAVDDADLYGSDLTLRVASAVILVAFLAATLWAGGVVFLLFIGIVALAAQIEFYAALRAGGYRPMVLFGLLGGLGALVGTYVQGSDVLREGPIAVAAALGLTVVATFAWYGSQESPPSDPWRNGLVTVLGVAWIPALLALVLPMAEAPRSDRFQIIIVLLIAVAAFDVGSYFVGRALGRRKLSPVLSPNKTVEGLIGGVIATVIVALVAAALVNVFDAASALAVAAGVIIAAPLGDLAESMIKRSLGIKDMGQLVPGHGGVLDRIDSYLFAVPIAYVVLRWTGLL